MKSDAIKVPLSGTSEAEEHKFLAWAKEQNLDAHVIYSANGSKRLVIQKDRWTMVNFAEFARAYLECFALK